MPGPWRSERLIYRAVEPEDEPFLNTVSSDPDAFMNAAPFMPIPISKKSSTNYRQYLDSMLVSAVICLPPPTNTTPTVLNGADDTAVKPIPIGVISLAGIDPRMVHHRRSEVVINIVRAYQRQGFGTEAIKWILHWGFVYANLHRIEIGAFGYNTGAIKLYERLGFVPEGRRRDWMWHEGQYRDMVCFGMLEDEWRELYGKDKK